MRDKRIKENPCRIPGADRESSPERPVLSVAEVFRIADVITPRYRALVLLATFGNLRWGELAGLRRRGLVFVGVRGGASLAELMSRMGHSSTRAAQVYLHARRERDREIAPSLGKMAKRELKKIKKAQKGRKPEGSGT